jgi:hypothetical protein
MRRSRAALIATGLLTAAASAARALDCPLPQPATTASALQESLQDIQVLSGLMAAQGTGVVPEIIAGLKRKYPAAPDSEIANYLDALLPGGESGCVLERRGEGRPPFCILVADHADLGWSVSLT